jgi:predicted MFS family arabinose efflux permease
MLRKFYTHWLNSFKGLPRGVWLLALINFINRCGGMVMIFISVYLTKELGYPITDAGYVMTCFGLGAITGNYLGGWLSDRVGYYHVQFFSLLLNGAFLLLMLLVRDFWFMCATMFVMSVISEAYRPANQVATASFTDPETRTRSISVLRLAYNIAFTLAPALGGIIAGTLGWNWLFWADGLTCIAAAIALRMLMRPVEKKQETPKEATKAATTALSDLQPHRDRPFMLFVLCTFFSAMAFMQMFWTLPVFFKDAHGWNEDAIGWMLALNGAIVFIVEIPLIFYIEKKYTSSQFIQFGSLLYIVAYASLMLPFGAIWVGILYMLFISLGEIFVMPFGGNISYSKAANSAFPGKYMAIYGLSYSVANVLAPLLGTQVIERWGFQWHWTITAGFALVALFGFRYLGRAEVGKTRLAV